MKKNSNFLESSNLPWENVDQGTKRQILGYDKNIMMVKVSFEKGSVGPQHKHFHSQATFVESGKFEVTINGNSKILSGGDAFYIPPEIMHGAVCLEPGILIDVFSPLREDFLE